MGKCHKCGTGTQLYSSGVPVCIQCVDALSKKPASPENKTGERNSTNEREEFDGPPWLSSYEG